MKERTDYMGSKIPLNEIRRCRELCRKNQEHSLHRTEKVQIEENGGSIPYLRFKMKLRQEKVDSFSSRDLVYYFREVSIEAGKKYSIANFRKDMHIMKVLQKDYTNAEIVLMIDFLFSEDNDYLNFPTINVMASQWRNTIYQDSQDWAEDKYVPHKKRGKKKIARQSQIEEREYKKSYENDISIGEW